MASLSNHIKFALSLSKGTISLDLFSELGKEKLIMNGYFIIVNWGKNGYFKP